ncbi:polyphosphate kinase 1 [Niabella hibiscisoli]|uniref:polyphosphate kinase 1 n=1 Tax=Niabella hibiscisoli TaxID=1825928 RepID=UPI001F0F7D02|nr:polyphosphate kinase 1 [Niabella hibiscisoli]MCH5717936.1 polyphosphate kinase 1 [Niabella hibiscisoli]
MNQQQDRFGRIVKTVKEELKKKNVNIVYNEPIPAIVCKEVTDYFFAQIAAFLRVAYPQSAGDFFPENNHVYLAAELKTGNSSQLAVITIPSDHIPRFFSVTKEGIQYVIFIDDIIKMQLLSLWPGITVNAAYSFKVTRDAEIDLDDEYRGNLAQKIAAQIAKRDFGLVTRLLYNAAMPEALLQQLVRSLGLQNAMIMPGGAYHNLKDLSAIPIKEASLKDEPWPAVLYPLSEPTLLESISRQDILLHLPFHNYDMVLRFFNEAALDRTVTEISMTMYRISGTSKIAEALITAALSGKKVTVFVELKARFDEANNISWARKMKAAGIRIIYSIPQMKVHAKVVLVKRKCQGHWQYLGLLGSGNFNEVTARFYTDQVLMTSNAGLLKDLDQLFKLLKKNKKSFTSDALLPQQLLIAPFNLQSRFAELIDREMSHARAGRKAEMIVKINNLEDEKMIRKLYEASNAGVTIQLIVRGICRLLPGVEGQSEHITVRRIVDRYLEHGRIFWFYNNSEDEIYMGSADWMTRNLYRRIEVCFPVLDNSLKASLRQVLDIYLEDTSKATWITAGGAHTPVVAKGKKVQAQAAMYQWVKEQSQ